MSCLVWLCDGLKRIFMGNAHGGAVTDKGDAVGGVVSGLGQNVTDAVGAIFHNNDVRSSWVELRLEGRHLLNKDVGGESDPLAVMYRHEAGKWHEVGRTEIVANNLNPMFVRYFELLYLFHAVQKFKVALYDVDEQGDPEDIDLTKQDFLGQAEFTLSSVVTSFRGLIEVPLWDVETDQPAGDGVLVVRYEDKTLRTEVVEIEFSASDLANRKRDSRPILLISRAQEDGTWAPVYRSESNKNEQPRWKTLEISLAQLCNGDEDRTLMIEVLNFRENGKHRPMAWTETCFREMKTLTAPLELQMPKSEKNGGSLNIKVLSIVEQPTFLEYVRAKFEICFLLAVDFTASNGQKEFPTSLHHLDQEEKKLNPYQEAITGVGKVLEYYDSDKKFPTWGFGGKVGPRQGRAEHISHCFALNGDDTDPECDGIEGILKAYRQALLEVKLAGPTCFAPIITASKEAAQRHSSPPKYYCLLILTDGIIMDMKNTVRSIVEASRLPLSILIVGVGEENFKDMEFLDADKHVLKSGDVRAERDIVQFVEFNRFKGDGEALASQLLHELPGQFLSYMRKREIWPNSFNKPESGDENHHSNSDAAANSHQEPADAHQDL
ncbi:hypothetical protein BSKO_11052 [Bryopsis sp. KO-2023]|nr:hypothetical protein BSKO_11052 [Bryopsis sp. KO-2023]